MTKDPRHQAPTLRLSLRLRGAQVKWVFPSKDNHAPESYFKKDATIYWYEFKSSSTKPELMSQPKFCGHEPGPRTHFIIEATRAYRIVEFSSEGEEEAEVLAFGRPLIVRLHASAHHGAPRPRRCSFGRWPSCASPLPCATSSTPMRLGTSRGAAILTW